MGAVGVILMQQDEAALEADSSLLQRRKIAASCWAIYSFAFPQTLAYLTVKF